MSTCMYMQEAASHETETENKIADIAHICTYVYAYAYINMYVNAGGWLARDRN